LIEFQNQTRILHWQTHSFARHKAYDEVYGELNELLDSFVESYQGKYDRIEFKTESVITLRDSKELDLNKFVSEFLGVLINEIPDEIDETDTDLFNIRDEILALVHKLKYLLSLK
jgi:hypothetical protein